MAAITTKQQTLYDHALERGQLGAGVSEEMSILTGHRVERREIGAPGEFDHLELEVVLLEEIQAPGLLEKASGTPH